MAGPSNFKKKAAALVASPQVYTERSLCKSSVKLALASLDAQWTRMCPVAIVRLAASWKKPSAIELLAIRLE